MNNAFNNDNELKSALVALAKQHREKDEYTAGSYGEKQGSTFKGCSVGCTIYDLNLLKNTKIEYSNHSELAKALGIPVFIARIQDCIFEGLPESHRYTWTERLFTAINVGSDLSSVMPKFLKVILENCLERIQRYESKQQKDAVLGVIKVIDDWIETGRPAAKAAASACVEACAADIHATDYAASFAAIAYAARAAVDQASIHSVVTYTTDTTTEAAAAAKACYAVSYAESAYHNQASYDDKFIYFSDELIKLIEQCKGEDRVNLGVTHYEDHS